jgi:MATE family multidrug resistance protein
MRPWRGTLLEIVRLALPLAFVQVGATSLGVIDTAVVGRTSAEQLAGVGLGNSLLFAISVVGMGLVVGAEPLVAQAVGRGDLVRARSWMRTALWAAVLVWPVITAIVLGLGVALPHFGVDAAVVPHARGYLAARAVGILPFLLYWAVKAYLQARGRTRAPVVGVVLAIVVEIVLDLLLVPRYGALGAGLANSVTNFVRLAAVVVAALGDAGPFAQLGARMKAAFVPRDLLAIARIGLPLGLQLALEVGVFAFAAVTIGRLGPVDLAAHQVSIQIASVTFNVMVGLGTATSVVVGQRIGAQDTRGAAQAGVLALLASVLFMLACGALFLWGGAWLARALTDDAAIVDRAAALLAVASAFQLSDGLQAVASGALRGAGDTRATFAIHLVSHWVIGFPCVIGFVALGLGAPGVWWGLTLGLTAAAIMLVARFWRGARRGFTALA